MPILLGILILVIGAFSMQSVREKKRNLMSNNADSNASVNESIQECEEFNQSPAAYEPAPVSVVFANDEGPFAAVDWSLYEKPTYLRRVARPLAA